MNNTQTESLRVANRLVVDVAKSHITFFSFNTVILKLSLNGSGPEINAARLYGYLGGFFSHSPKQWVKIYDSIDRTSFELGDSRNFTGEKFPLVENREQGKIIEIIKVIYPE